MIMNDPLKKYRKQFRAWRNNIRLKRELDYYRGLFQSRRLKVPDDEAIRQALRSKYPDLKSKSKGNLNILAIYHHYNWENESLKPALEKFGSVRHYDWVGKFNRRKKAGHKSAKSDMSRHLIEEIKGWGCEAPLDVIFSYLSGGNVTADTVRKIGALGVPMVNMFLNDKEGFVGKVYEGQAIGIRDICRYFDLSWTSTKDALIKYCVEDALPVYLPEGANPEIHKPYNEEKTTDVSFVGQCYGKRPEIIQKLRDQKIHVNAYGYGWPDGPLSTQEMVRMYSKSKINLGFGEVDAFKDTFCLKGRDFEIPMSGGLYLTQHHSELEACYDLGTEIVTYSDFDDLVAKIRYLLSNLEKADAIRKKGRQRAVNEHTWEKRFEKIFSLMGII